MLVAVVMSSKHYKSRLDDNIKPMFPTFLIVVAALMTNVTLLCSLEQCANVTDFQYFVKVTSTSTQVDKPILILCVLCITYLLVTIAKTK